MRAQTLGGGYKNNPQVSLHIAFSVVLPSGVYLYPRGYDMQVWFFYLDSEWSVTRVVALCGQGWREGASIFFVGRVGFALKTQQSRDNSQCLGGNDAKWALFLLLGGNSGASVYGFVLGRPFVQRRREEVILAAWSKVSRGSMERMDGVLKVVLTKQKGVSWMTASRKKERCHDLEEMQLTRRTQGGAFCHPEIGTRGAGQMMPRC